MVGYRHNSICLVAGFFKLIRVVPPNKSKQLLALSYTGAYSFSSTKFCEVTLILQVSFLTSIAVHLKIVLRVIFAISLIPNTSNNLFYLFCVLIFYSPSILES